MLRLLPRIVAGICALLALACLSLWLRSYPVLDRAERLHYSFPPATACLDRLEIISASGGICFDRIVGENDMTGSNFDHQVYLRDNGWSFSHAYFHESAGNYFLRQGGRPFLGLGYKTTTSIEPSGSKLYPRPNSKMIRRQLLIPWALPVLIFLIPPSLLARQLLRTRRQRLRLSRNLCPSCGYDLRASPAHCPECGKSAAIASPKPKATAPEIVGKESGR